MSQQCLPGVSVLKPGQGTWEQVTEQRTQFSTLFTHTPTHRSAPFDCQIWLMGIAAGVAPLMALSVTPQWLHVKISPACHSLHRTRNPAENVLQIDIKVCAEELAGEGADWWVKKDRGKVGQQAWEFMCYRRIRGPISGQSLCVRVSREKGKHRPERACAELDLHRRIWLKCIPLPEWSKDVSPPDARVSTWCPAYTSGRLW